MTQPGLFDDDQPRGPKANARHADPSTSHDAAQSLGARHLGELQRLIVAALHQVGPSTTSEIAAVLDYPRDSISPRMKTLVAMQQVEDSGTKRPGPSGRAQIVWALPKESQGEEPV